MNVRSIGTSQWSIRSEHSLVGSVLSAGSLLSGLSLLSALSWRSRRRLTGSG